jgi:hypothetical protein
VVAFRLHSWPQVALERGDLRVPNPTVSRSVVLQQKRATGTVGHVRGLQQQWIGDRLRRSLRVDCAPPGRARREGLNRLEEGSDR